MQTLTPLAVAVCWLDVLAMILLTGRGVFVAEIMPGRRCDSPREDMTERGAVCVARFSRLFLLSLIGLLLISLLNLCTDHDMATLTSMEGHAPFCQVSVY